jgi:hypothetical protein
MVFPQNSGRSAFRFENGAVDSDLKKASKSFWFGVAIGGASATLSGGPSNFPDSPGSGGASSLIADGILPPNAGSDPGINKPPIVLRVNSFHLFFTATSDLRLIAFAITDHRGPILEYSSIRT